jgi:hypothetical protein
MEPRKTSCLTLHYVIFEINFLKTLSGTKGGQLILREYFAIPAHAAAALPGAPLPPPWLLQTREALAALNRRLRLAAIEQLNFVRFILF